jgi:hypothetical protein
LWNLWSCYKSWRWQTNRDNFSSKIAKLTSELTPWWLRFLEVV